MSPMLLLALLSPLLGSSNACNRKHAAEFVEIHFGREVEQICLSRGQRCRYDRNCCAGLECRMGAVAGGWSVATACQPRLVYEDYEEPRVGPTWQDYQSVEASWQGRGAGELRRRNDWLRRRLGELSRLRAAARASARAAERAELARERARELEALKGAADRLEGAELEVARREARRRRLLEEERRQVNLTLADRRGDLGLYTEMLDDLVDADAINKRISLR